MKINRSIPILLIVLLSTCSLIAFYSCTEKKASAAKYMMFGEHQESRYIEQNEALQNQAEDSTFLREIAEVNLLDIKCGQLAQLKSHNNDIIQLGTMVASEKTDAQDELLMLTASKQTDSMPKLDQQQQKTYHELSGLEAKDFDRAYAKMFVEGQKESIMLFEMKIKETKNIHIYNWIEKTLPVMRRYLEYAEICKNNV